MLGYAYASRHRERAAYRWSADVSVYVREEARGKGIGRALYTSLFAILRLQGIYNILAGITPAEPRQRRASRGDGFAADGHLPAHRLQMRRSGTTWAGGSSSF